MIHLIVDTETNGRFNFKSDHRDPKQPRIVQLGAIMCDDEGKVFAELNLLIKPDGWIITPELTAIHGITTQMCETYGVPITVAMSMFSNLQRIADVFVAFNEVFDRSMLNSEYWRLQKFDRLLKQEHCHCVMLASTKDCNLPGGRNGQPKWPSLEQAHRHYFNEFNERAHDAMEDVKACGRIYFLRLWRAKENAEKTEQKPLL